MARSAGTTFLSVLLVFSLVWSGAMFVPTGDPPADSASMTQFPPVLDDDGGEEHDPETDNNGGNTPGANVVTLAGSEANGDVRSGVGDARSSTARNDGDSNPVTGEIAKQSELTPMLAMADSTSSIFDAGASYRVFTRYGNTTEIVLADYLAAGATGIKFTLKSCDSSQADYYSAVGVENGNLVLDSNTLGHVHGPNTQAETVCTVTATGENGSEDRKFRLYTVADRTPLALPPGALTLVEARPGEVDVRISVPGASLGYFRLGWRKAGGQSSFGVVCGVNNDTVITITGLEAGTEYEVRAYAMTTQAFDLYRVGNACSPGVLIAEGEPDSQWISNLSGGGLGKSQTITVSTTPVPTPTPTPSPTPEATLVPTPRPTPDDDDDDDDDDGTDRVDTPTPDPVTPDLLTPVTPDPPTPTPEDPPTPTPDTPPTPTPDTPPTPTPDTPPTPTPDTPPTPTPDTPPTPTPDTPPTPTPDTPPTPTPDTPPTPTPDTPTPDTPPDSDDDSGDDSD